MLLPDPSTTESPEAKHFLLWLRNNGFTEIWKAYDRPTRVLYRRSMGLSADHMEEISRVMADPWFGVTE